MKFTLSAFPGIMIIFLSRGGLFFFHPYLKAKHFDYIHMTKSRASEAVNSTALIIWAALRMLRPETRAPFCCRCRAAPGYRSTASDQSALTGQELCAPRTAGQMSAGESGAAPPEKRRTLPPRPPPPRPQISRSTALMD